MQPSRVRLAYAYTVEVEPARKEGESHAPGPGLRLVVVVWPLGAGRPAGGRRVSIGFECWTGRSGYTWASRSFWLGGLVWTGSPAIKNVIVSPLTSFLAGAGKQ